MQVIAAGEGEIWFESEGLFVTGNAPFGVSEIGQGAAQVVEGLRKIRLQDERLLMAFGGVFKPPQFFQGIAQVVVKGRYRGAQGNGLLDQEDGFAQIFTLIGDDAQLVQHLRVSGRCVKHLQIERSGFAEPSLPVVRFGLLICFGERLRCAHCQ